MAYSKQTWADLPSKTTPINATRLGHIEDGIYNAAATADTAASTAGTAAANVGIVSGRVETLTGRVNDLDTAVSNKVDKVTGKGLSENDFTNTLKSKLDGIASGAEVNVQSDWNEDDSSSDAFILNKPTLGTASTKNSTSVVTDSTDLVESGAVKDIVGWGNKNLLDPSILTLDGPLRYSPVYVGDGDFTLSTTAPLTVNNAATMFFLAGNVDSGASTSDNGVWSDNPRTVTSINGYVTVVSRALDGVNPRLYTNQLEKGSTATAFEPYHASVEESLAEKCDNSTIAPTENGTTASQAYAVGSHAIRNGAFITWKNAKAQGETINDASDYTSGDVANSLVYTVDYTTAQLSALNWNSPTGGQLSYATALPNNVLPDNAKIISAVVCEPWGSSIDVMPHIAIATNNRNINLVIKQSDTPGNGQLSVRLTYILI